MIAGVAYPTQFDSLQNLARLGLLKVINQFRELGINEDISLLQVCFMTNL